MPRSTLSFTTPRPHGFRRLAALLAATYGTDRLSEESNLAAAVADGPLGSFSAVVRSDVHRAFAVHQYVRR